MLNQSTDLEWTLERAKLAVSKGSQMTPVVVDIGDGLLIKYGRRVHLREAEATKLIAAQTSIPVATVIATLYDDAESTAYIVFTKLPGQSLSVLLPTLDLESQVAIEEDLKKINLELSSLDSYAPMGLVGTPSEFPDFSDFRNHGAWKATNTFEFLNWPIETANRIVGKAVFGPVDPSKFDFTEPHVFSHGDLVPENILVHNGRVSGIIDWEYAGWYPYFWNDYVAWRRARGLHYPEVWSRMVHNILTTDYRSDWLEYSRIYWQVYAVL